MKTWLILTVAGTVLLAGACSSTFLFGKDGRGYFFGSDSKAVYDMLCASGDLEKVLADTHLDAEMKQSLYAYNCSAERSTEKVKQIYASLAPQQRKDIRTAFKNNGYDINYLPCCGDSINSTSGRM